MVLECGHHEACMYRYIHRGIRKKYCMACVVENFPDAEIGGIRNQPTNILKIEPKKKVETLKKEKKVDKKQITDEKL